MSYGYGGRQNPYAQQESPAGAYGAPSEQDYGQQNYGGAPQQDYPQQNYGGGFGRGGYDDNVEMVPLAQSAGPVGSGASPLKVIDEIKMAFYNPSTRDGIDTKLDELAKLQNRALDETDPASSTHRQLDDLGASIMSDCRALVPKIQSLKASQQNGQYDHLVKTYDAQVKERIAKYQQLDYTHRQKMKGQMERQYRIVRPDADDNEIRAAVDDMSAGGQQVFQQAMMQSNRQGQARAVLNEVQNRHQELLKIEQQMTELTQLMIDLDTIIVQQEPMVQQIDEHVEKTQEDLKQGNIELDTAVETVRSTRKKKWICCGIVAAIILIIVIAVVVYFVTKPPAAPAAPATTTPAKRGLADLLADRSISDIYAQSGVVARSIAGRIVLPVDFRELNAGRTATLPVAIPK